MLLNSLPHVQLRLALWDDTKHGAKMNTKGRRRMQTGKKCNWRDLNLRPFRMAETKVQIPLYAVLGKIQPKQLAIEVKVPSYFCTSSYCGTHATPTSLRNLESMD